MSAKRKRRASIAATKAESSRAGQTSVIFEFVEIALSKSDLLCLPAKHLQFLISSCIAANDLTIFSRLLLLHGHANAASEVVRKYQAVNTMVFVRQLLRAVLEFNIVLRDFAPFIADSGLRSRAENV